MIHHHPDTQEIAEHLGRIVEFEMNDGTHIEGRVDAVDEVKVALGRTRHHTVRLVDIKRVVKATGA